MPFILHIAPIGIVKFPSYSLVTMKFPPCALALNDIGYPGIVGSRQGGRGEREGKEREGREREGKGREGKPENLGERLQCNRLSRKTLGKGCSAIG